MDERYENREGFSAPEAEANGENIQSEAAVKPPEELWKEIQQEHRSREAEQNAETGSMKEAYQASEEEDKIGQMTFSPEGERNAANKKQKQKKARKPMGGFAKSALNGLAFGLCAAIVFVGIMVIGNKTFLKKTDAAEEVAAGSVEENTETEAKKEETVKETGEAEAKEENKGVATNSKSEAATISEITKNTMPSIVSITVKGVEEVMSMFGMQQYESEGAGSGIVISDNGDEFFIATNNHVVAGANEVSVCFDDTEDSVVKAEVRGTDEANDLAIVSVKKEDINQEVLEQIKVISIGSSDALQVGDQVVAIGNALGYGQSVTTGIVSAMNRDVEIDNLSAKLIQTDAAINPGNSGGALLNMNGELVGINSAKFASETVEGMGYAIPVDTARPILDKLMNRAGKEVVADDEAGFLGVTVQDVSSEAAQSYGIPSGAYIGAVEEGGAADKAGLLKGDVIQSLDGIGISGAADLKAQLSYYKQGETVEVGYMRQVNGEYESQSCKVKLAASDAALKQRQQERANEEAAEQREDTEEQEESTEDAPRLPDRGRGYSDDGQDGYGGSEGYSDEDLEEFFERFFGQAQQYGYGTEPQTNKGI